MASDGNSGPKPRVSDEDIASVFIEADEPFLSTDEVASELPIKFRQTFDRLESLEDDGILRSKQLAGSNVWWHQQVEATHAWPMNGDGEEANSTPGIIGVPYVDNLDVPGKGEDVYYRRLSINAVFRHLFRETEVGHAELRKLAWVATPRNTFDSEKSLWNNCIVSALNQSIFITPRKEHQKWILVELGDWVADFFNEKAIWEDWGSVKSRLESRISETTSQGIRFMLESSYDVEPIHVVRSNSDTAYILRVDRFHYGLEFGYAESTWREGEFEINVVTEYSGDSEGMDKLKDNSENIADVFKQDIDLNEDGDRITVSLPIAVTLTPNSPSLGLSGGSARPPVENPQSTVNTIRRFDESLRNIVLNL